VTGASGLLGRKVIHSLSEKHLVYPTHNLTTAYSNSIQIDITNRDHVQAVLKEVKPEVVVHAAAETNVDRCETSKDLAWAVNVEGTKNIAESCSSIGARLVYISTDYVFNGEKGLYTEDDAVNPVNYYGLTKLKGEEIVRNLCEDSVIARTSVVYGWHPKKTNFATWVINSLRQGKQISVVEDHHNSPTLADDLAGIITKIIGTDVCGTYHAASGERVSRFEFALKIADVFELERTLLKAVKIVEFHTWIARRPKDSSLCVEKIRKDIGIQPLDLAEALRRMKENEPAGMD